MPEYCGKLAKVTELGVLLAREYELLFGVGSEWQTQRAYDYCHAGGRYELVLLFIDQEPWHVHGLTFYCLKEVGAGALGDWHYYTLDQLVLCP